MSFPADTGGTRPSGRPPDGFVLGPDEGEPFFWLGSLTLTKVEGSQTHGGVDIVDHRVPSGYAPPSHVHETSDEIFYVIEGQFDVHCGEQRWSAGPGALVFLPRQVPHGFVVSEDGPARTLLINAPAGFAEIITELGTPAPELVLPGPDVVTPDPGRIAAVSEAHGVHNA